MKEGIKNVGQQERPHRFYCGPREHPGEFGGCKSETAAARVTPDRVGFGPLLCILSTLMGVQRAPHPPSSQHQPLPPPRTTLRDDPVLKLMSIESVMPSNHLILCHPQIGRAHV